MRKLMALVVGAMIIMPAMAATDTAVVTVRAQVQDYVDLMTADGIIDLGSMTPITNDTKLGYEGLGWVSNVNATVTVFSSNPNPGVTFGSVTSAVPAELLAPDLVTWSNAGSTYVVWGGAVAAGSNVMPSSAGDVNGAAYLEVEATIDETVAPAAGGNVTLGTITLQISGSSS